MKATNRFTPKEYISSVKARRRKLLRRSLFGVATTATVFVGIATTTGYTEYFSVNLSEAAKPLSYRSQQPMQYDQAPEQKPINEPKPVEEVDEWTSDEEESEEDYYEDYDYFTENGCNVLGLTISGDIGTDYGYTSANYFRDTFEAYADHVGVQAILLDVDSPGGSPVGGDEIKTLIEEQTVPVIAQVRELAASAAYMAILPADYIFAHRYGSIGSIGVIIQQYDYSSYNDKEGIKYAPLMTAPYKDMGTIERPLTKEERSILQNEIDFIHSAFVSDVATYRGIPLEKAKELANGRTLMAHEAVEAGLIDEVGGRPEVTDYLRELLGAEPVVCWESAGY